MRGRTLVWLAALVMLVAWLIVGASITSGAVAQASGWNQIAWSVAITMLMGATGYTALMAAEVAKLEHEQAAPESDDDVTTGGRRVR